MDQKITIIGGGSSTFVPQLIRLIIGSELLDGSTVVLMDIDPHVPRLDIKAPVDRRRKGGHSHVLGVDLQQNMVHGSVTHNGHVHDIGGPQAGMAYVIWLFLGPPLFASCCLA